MSPTADPATVLVVEDDPGLNTALATTLRLAGFRLVTAYSADEGLRGFAHHAPDLVLLDLGLPGRDGLTVIREIRQRAATPILVLAARNGEAAKAEALGLGADGYVQKPFGLEELLNRLRAGLTHGAEAGGAEPVVHAGDVTIDFGRRHVSRSGMSVRLSPKEFELLCQLAIQLDRTVRHRDLLRAVWGDEATEIQYLRVYMGQLRHKLGSERIVSEAGVGYRLKT